MTVICIFPAAPFDVRINPVYVDVIAGASFDATCTSKGDPAPTFAWYYSDRMIQTGPQLTVTSTVSTDGGLYTCVATNSQGMAQASMDANVRCKYYFKFVWTSLIYHVLLNLYLIIYNHIPM